MSILPIVSIRMIAAATLSALQATSVWATERCFPKPDLGMTSGGHWYYYSDTDKNRKCWFLRQAVARQASPSIQVQTSPDTAPGSKTQSWLSSLASALSPASEGDQALAAQSDNRTKPASPNSRKRSAARQPQPASSHSRNKQPSKPGERSSRPSSEKMDQSAPALDQASREALFREFLLWKERHNGVGTKLDQADRDTLFREFLVWSGRQRRVEPQD